MMNVRYCFFLTMLGIMFAIQTPAQCGFAIFLQTMEIHRLNHKLSCMVSTKVDDIEQRRNFFKSPK